MGLKENLKQMRKERNMTLENVAEYIGVNRQTVQKYESGLIANIPSDKIEKLAECFRTTPAYLMGWEDASDNGTVIDAVVKYAKEINGDTMLDLLQKFNKLSEEDKELALKMIGKMNGGK